MRNNGRLAATAILGERTRRGYHVVTRSYRRPQGLCGVSIPPSLEAWCVETTCTEHDPPCTWIDFAFRQNDDSFRVVLQEDLSRRPSGTPDNTVVFIDLEHNARQLITELMNDERMHI